MFLCMVRSATKKPTEDLWSDGSALFVKDEEQAENLQKFLEEWDGVSFSIYEHDDCYSVNVD